MYALLAGDKNDLAMWKVFPRGIVYEHDLALIATSSTSYLTRDLVRPWRFANALEILENRCKDRQSKTVPSRHRIPRRPDTLDKCSPPWHRCCRKRHSMLQPRSQDYKQEDFLQYLEQTLTLKTAPWLIGNENFHFPPSFIDISTALKKYFL